MIIILMGVTGCGKTSVGKLLSQRTGLSFLDADDFHPPENIRKMQSGKPLNDDDRMPWLKELLKQITRANRGQGCILACSALKQSYRDVLKSNPDLEVKFVYLKGSRELIARRLQERKKHFMPAQLLDSQFNDLEEPQDALTVSVDQTPEAIAAEILLQIKP